MKKLTYKELEREYKETRDRLVTAMIGLILIGLFLLAITILNISLRQENQALKEQLRESNWNNYSIDFWYKCLKVDGKEVQGYWAFNGYGDYMNARFILKSFNCEVFP